MQPKYNYLDFIPKHGSLCRWELTRDKNVTVILRNTRFWDRAAQLLYFAPCETRFSLDEFGGFVWQCIDGKLSVEEIARRMEAHFGEKTNPLYPRLIEYLELLRKNRFISFLPLSSGDSSFSV